MALDCAVAQTCHTTFTKLRESGRSRVDFVATAEEKQEFEELVRLMEPLRFTESHEVARYFVKQRLCDRYPHLVGSLKVHRGGDCWQFSGALQPHWFAQLCQRLGLGVRGADGAQICDSLAKTDGAE